MTKNTRVLPFNDAEAVVQLFKNEGKSIAAIIMEPVCGNMGVVLPTKNFLDACVSECNANGALLIFDEVMTGFRAGKHGAQGYIILPQTLLALEKSLVVGCRVLLMVEKPRL